MNIYLHEIESYKYELNRLKKEEQTPFNKKDNLTHLGLARSNRYSYMLVGLCSLVEALLYEIAEKGEKNNVFKISDIKGNGINKLKTYIVKTLGIDFGKINNWEEFTHIYKIRNVIIHSYGGLFENYQLNEIKKSLKILGIQNSLFSEKRIRLTNENLTKILHIIKNIIYNLEDFL